MKKSPNILFILSDQHRRDCLGCYGNDEVISPRFDRMANEGIRFEHCAAAHPVCAPFRAALQTGLYPHQNGVESNRHELRLPENHRCLADYFNEAGYETCFIGKSHFEKNSDSTVPGKPGFVRPEKRLGWKTWLGSQGHSHYETKVFDDGGELLHDFTDQYAPTMQTDLALDFIREQGDKPWLVQLNWGPPHTVVVGDLYDREETYEKMKRLNEEMDLGLDSATLEKGATRWASQQFPQALLAEIVPQRYLDMYRVEELTLAPTVPEKWKRVVQYVYQEYYAMITSMDDELGRILDFLNESEVGENTIVIYTSDHGDQLASDPGVELRGKARPRQSSYRVPLLAWGPRAGVPQGVTTDALINTVDWVPTLCALAGIECDSNLPGRSMAEWITKGEGEKQEALYMSLHNWRAVWTGEYCYSAYRAEGVWSERSLINVRQDAYDQRNLIESSEHQETKASLRKQMKAFVEALEDVEVRL